MIHQETKEDICEHEDLEEMSQCCGGYDVLESGICSQRREFRGFEYRSVGCSEPVSVIDFKQNK